MIDRLDTLADIGVDTNERKNIQRSFELDYHANPPQPQLLQLPEINQKPDETRNENFARAIKLLVELDCHDGYRTNGNNQQQTQNQQNRQTQKMATSSNSKMAKRRSPHAHTARNMVTKMKNV